MHTRSVVLGRGLMLVALIVAVPAAAGRTPKRAPEGSGPTPPAATAPTADARPAGRGLSEVASLWSSTLPISPGPLPAGLANLSAQGCAACHSGAVDQWRASGHAKGPPAALVEAAAAAQRPDCLTCHLPLDVQHRERFAPDPVDPSRFVTALSAAFDATLSSEGATCVACHVRDGHVIGARRDARPPHATKASASLRTSEACATCHQLAWPGADRPLYDTYGEWKRSGWADAGVTCQGCHMGPPVAGAAPTHAVGLPATRALSALLRLPPAAIVRGQAPVAGELVVQNTGAGHAFPTGSPFRGARLEVVVEGPAARGDGRQVWHEAGVLDLRRSIDAAPPFATRADTRLQAGAQRAVPLTIALPVDAPRGGYDLVVRLIPTRGDEDAGPPTTLQRVAVPVR